MKKFLYIFLFIPVTLTAQRYVSGTITDADNNNEPVVGASVFISNTTIGDYTDAEGHYQLKIPEEGSYRLTISFMGYQSVSKDIDPGHISIKFDVTLHVSINELKEVTVTAKARFRQTDINLFWNTILGKTPSSKTIQVTNPDAVYYNYDSEKRILKVTCREPLQIVNYETGYKIHCVLNYFTHDYNKNISDWGNQFVFTELEPENSGQKNSREKKRREVYNISLVKFIKSLYNNTLYDDGFLLAAFSQSSDPNHPYRISPIDPESILSPKSADNGRTLKLSDKQIILICYGRPVTAYDLDMIQQTQSKRFLDNSGFLMNLLQGDYIRIFPDGTYANKLLMTPVNSSNTLLGLNMRLPIEYNPEEPELSVAKTKNTFDFDSIVQHFDAQLSLFPQEKIHLHTDRDFYVPGEKIWFKAYVVDAATLQPSTDSRYVYAELINSRDSLVSRVMIRPENDMFYGYLPLSSFVPEGNYTLRAYTRYMENMDDDYFFKKNIRIGNLASDKRLFSQTEQNKGNVRIASDDFEISQTDSCAYSLTVSQQDKMLTVDVLKSANAPDISYYLLGSCRGEVFHFSAMNKDNEFTSFPEEDLPGGVLQFILFDEQMNPLSERLVFSKNYDTAKVVLHTDKALYGKREKVLATLSLTDSDGNPLTGNLSVAVTDDNDIAVDSTTTILSSLLLSSELKGYIENPAWYLLDTGESTAALDNLMLTHKWKRYNIPEIVKGNYESPRIPFQTGMEISGRVKSGNRSKPVQDGEVLIMAKNGSLGSALTDKNGAFTYKDFEYPDSTSYFIQASGKKGSSGVELVLNEDSFPKLNHALQNSVAEIPNAFIAKAEQRSWLDEDMRMIQLGEVVITAPRIDRKDESRRQFWANIGSDVTVRREEIERMKPRLVSDILRGIAGVRVEPDGAVFIRESMSLYSGTLPLVLIDGMPVDWPPTLSKLSPYNTPLETVNVSEVESIDVFKGASASAFGVRGANGVISITTRRGADIIRDTESAHEGKAHNFAIYTPLGYQKQVEFYSPVYETPEAKQSTVPDYRTTIFWKPNIVTSDTGEAGFEFYTSDFSTTYSVVIEGLTDDGRIIRQEEKIQVE